MRISRTLTLAGVLLAVALAPLPGACKAQDDRVMGLYIKANPDPPPIIVPYIDPAYYGCIEVLPTDLQNAYYTAYGNHAEAEVAYTGKVFVFKNQLVDLYMIRELDKGWVWADLTKCPVINIDDAKKLEPGDRVDIVGMCGGRNTNISPGLFFIDCYVLVAGSVQLPAPGNGGGFAVTY